MWKEVKSIIQSQDSFLITTHLNPDGDGVGSAVAMIELLRAKGKNVIFCTDKPIPEKFHFLNFHDVFFHWETVPIKSFAVVIILDTSKKERIGRVAELIDNCKPTTICIDHHVAQVNFTPFAVIDPEACAVGAMVHSLYKDTGLELTLEAAMGIYTSIISDTGRFSYASTSCKAHQIAEECLKVGVDVSHMYAHLFQQIPFDQCTLFSKALNHMEFHLDQKIVVQQFRFKDYEAYWRMKDIHLFQDFDFIHEFNKSIKGVECGVILWEMPDGSVRVSLRSKGTIDIIQPMKELGGGGHPNAAGAHLFKPFEEVKHMVLSLLKSSFQKLLFE